MQEINLKEVVKVGYGAKFVELRLILENRCDFMQKQTFLLLGPGQKCKKVRTEEPVSSTY